MSRYQHCNEFDWYEISRYCDLNLYTFYNRCQTYLGRGCDSSDLLSLSMLCNEVSTLKAHIQDHEPILFLNVGSLGATSRLGDGSYSRTHFRSTSTTMYVSFPRLKSSEMYVGY